MEVTIKENRTLKALLYDLGVSPQKRGGNMDKAFTDGLRYFYESILGPWDEFGIPVWSGEGKSSFYALSFIYGVDIDWESDPALPYISGKRRPSRNKIASAGVEQSREDLFRSEGRWVWTLEISIPWLEENEFPGGERALQEQRPRPWGIFERARKEAVREINNAIERRLGQRVSGVRGAING